MILPLWASLNSETSWLMASTAGPEFEYQNVTVCSPVFASALVSGVEPQADRTSMGRAATATAFSRLDFLMVRFPFSLRRLARWPPAENRSAAPDGLAGFPVNGDWLLCVEVRLGERTMIALT